MSGSVLLAVVLLPSVVMLELSYLGFAWLGVIRYRLRGRAALVCADYRPTVSCIITCYSEGRDVERTILSLLDQDYRGRIEILPVIDGAWQNRSTRRAVEAMQLLLPRFPGRTLKILPKWPRGGRSSSLNAGLSMAGGEIVMALDGDTSFDYDMVRLAVRHFQEGGVIALAGTLRVRNYRCNLLTRLQALDYLIFRQLVRTGLGEFNVVNNVPGAHGIFRTAFLRTVGGWDNGSAEDVDLALRIKKYFRRYPSLRINADPRVISHTDVPERWRDFLRQRLRWEGDPAYLYLRKHAGSLRPGLMGWRNFLFSIWYGVIFQLLLPPLFLLALLCLLLLAPGIAVAIFLCSYALYFGFVSCLFLLQLLLISERPREDAGLCWLLPLYPLFVLLLRMWSALAVCHNLLLRSHLDSSMAPWWVLRKGRF